MIGEVKFRDPTYNIKEIKANPTWHLAWALSEWHNDSAPIGWGRYLQIANFITEHFDITPKESSNGKMG